MEPSAAYSPSGNRISRRDAVLAALGLARFLGVAPSAAGAAPGADLQVDRLAFPKGAEVRCIRRQYRADAVILLFSMPVFRIAGVGSGFAARKETPPGDSRWFSLEFAGGTLPERTRGLNRQGFFREVVVEKRGIPVEAAYFGALVASREGNLSEARGNLALRSPGDVAYQAIDGCNAAGRTRSARTRFLYPAGETWNNRLGLFRAARAHLQSGEPRWRESAWPPELSAASRVTFLYALYSAIARSSPTAQIEYIYNEKLYRMKTVRARDPRQAAAFAARGLTAHPERVVAIRATTTEVKTGLRSSFQVWIEDGVGAALPLRIEHQPTAFLRIAFEYDPTLPPVRDDKEEI